MFVKQLQKKSNCQTVFLCYFSLLGCSCCINKMRQIKIAHGAPVCRQESTLFRFFSFLFFFFGHKKAVNGVHKHLKGCHKVCMAPVKWQVLMLKLGTNSQGMFVFVEGKLGIYQKGNSRVFIVMKIYKQFMIHSVLKNVKLRYQICDRKPECQTSSQLQFLDNKTS